MAQLWGGRFTKETDQLVYDFNASILFDQKLLEEDVTGSKAHVTMLCKQGIVTEAEKEQIIAGLESILKDALDGTLPITTKYEDVHSFVEANLIDRIGDEVKSELTIVATGGLSRSIIPYCRHDVILDDDLILKGLLIIYNKNK